MLAALATLAVIGLVELGNWQLARRTWKQDLIARVDARVHAQPVRLPGPPDWPRISAAQHEYRRVQATGRFLRSEETLVQASTALGAGYWVISPLRTEDGFLVLVNRGFVPGERREAAGLAGPVPDGVVTVTGLMRMTEPGGGFLRANVPAEERWYSRDVSAIAAARRLGDVAPYFIDAEAGPHPGRWPAGGLTVITFPDNHLVYALTWYALALLLAGSSLYVEYEEWRASRQPGSA
ncbi:MAG TPA: SURF1 family protein [Crenalkalicoccus sp.]|nr:SURF1 family protein [Crenalkalicoccus sp.]